MNITLTIDAPELASAINNLAIAMGATGNPLPAIAPTTQKEDKPTATKPEPEKEETKKTEPIPEPEATNEKPASESEATEAPRITLEAVRGKLADFSAGGKANQVKVKEALTELGVKKLTDVAPADYAKLLEAVGLSA